jgi:hypothetical protein
VIVDIEVEFVMPGDGALQAVHHVHGNPQDLAIAGDVVVVISFSSSVGDKAISATHALGLGFIAKRLQRDIAFVVDPRIQVMRQGAIATRHVIRPILWQRDDFAVGDLRIR